MILAVLDLSRIVARTPDLPAREAWKLARRWVRVMAAQEGHRHTGEWYRTRNRVGFACGKYRATPIVAESASAERSVS